MRLIVTGSRTWTDRARLESVIDRVRLLAEALGSALIVVHGDCPRGADRMADEYAAKHGLAVHRFPADWDRDGRQAGMIRNADMATAGADLCIAFRAEGKSNGTDHMVRTAQALHIPTFVIEASA